ncbi:hypothetical protein LS482_16250 [Sinomicrobium kalidii]|uniref:hypothetical protein n=1 Tax=Sinomicrobium kalidii TaxID=2900738 RepID=UPI001E369137|nr:hypothetical protein [Sinomicrobium kalidii]UGU15225.1 hypothetical protein LS482_16250 [Sinomicrobium kalidii]
MAKTALSILKNWFRNGLKPTQEHFWNWLDSFWHKDEKIPTATIDGLDKILEDVPSSEQFQNHLTDTNAHHELFDTKVDKAEGYGLSQEDYTPEEKEKLADLRDHSQEIDAIFSDLADKQDIITGDDDKILPEFLPELAISGLVENVTEDNIGDFAANSLDTDEDGNPVYEFQQGDVVVIKDTDGNVLHYFFKGGDKTDINNYSLINATKVSWNNITGKPNLLTQPSTLEEVLARNNTADNDLIVNKVVARFSPANPAKITGELRNTGLAVAFDGTDVFRIGRLSGNNETVDFYLHDTENGLSTIMTLRPKIQGSAATFYGPVSGSPATSPGHFVTFSQIPRTETGTFEPNFKVVNGEVEGITGNYAFQQIGNIVTAFLNFSLENATSTNETGAFEFDLPLPSNGVYAGSGKVGTATGVHPVASGTVGRFWAGAEAALSFQQVKGSGGTIIISITYMTNQ